MQGFKKPPLPTRTHKHSRDLRQTSTDAERKLWYRLRAGRLNGYKFRRQHPIPPYVVDFYCEAARLVIELDGSQHNQAVDQIRAAYMEVRGLKTLRFWDNEALQQTDAILETILRAVSDRISTL
ncbi:DUF559 domain-containing protein [Dyella sp. LX-66]|uniref:endonuclease domain-containing protein n=1 Tax=unclassified Dyella TaxID=2634549 RepID=UPI001BE0608A|nr:MULTISPECIES: DUF559 domain-containing protein [unclassified Dyella]MBT2117287.1 DUF559 domain-containing protein [Dyella sp. LX-1]MBT2138351.1 DUF559 domain-containing protein [Dyella sp. LX-66]